MEDLATVYFGKNKNVFLFCYLYSCKYTVHMFFVSFNVANLVRSSIVHSVVQGLEIAQIM